MSENTEEGYRALLVQVNKVLTARTDAATGDRITLRDAVCAYVSVEQARGIAIDRVVQAVDAILRKAEEGAAKGADAMRRRDDALASQLVHWCLAFGTSETGRRALA